MAMGSMHEIDNRRSARGAGHFSRTTVVTVIIVLTVLVGGGGVYAYYSLVQPDHDQRLTNAIVNTMTRTDELKAGVVSGSAALRGSVTGWGAIQPKATFTGGFDRNTSGKRRSEQRVSVSNIPTGPSPAPSLDLGAHIISADEHSYIKLEGPERATAFLPDTIERLVVDRWIELPQTTNTATATNTSLDASSAKMTQNDAASSGENPLPPALQLYKEYPFVKVQKVLGTVNVNGQPAHHMNVTVDPDMWRSYVAAYTQRVGNIPFPFSLLHGGQKDQAIRLMTETFQRTITESSIEVWVSKQEPRILKTDIRIQMDLQQFLRRVNELTERPMVLPDTISLQTLTASISVNLTEAYSISVPQDPVKLSEVADEITSALQNLDIPGHNIIERVTSVAQKVWRGAPSTEEIWEGVSTGADSAKQYGEEAYRALEKVW